ncbi:hypothetical protein BCD64_06565 [Nostoc sp. MBR 210]|nr:hypothetical protein BCD64_06565 [Nostoc sp. MBR 210]
MDTAKGQIIPDNTLGAEKSIVNSNANTDRINGGARRGANLFHSFREFNIGKEGKAYFSNPAGVENIFSRVTGDRRSDILGTLGVADDGNADLFFMNPNGIFFGPNARLDMRGSFLASTANSLLFDGGLEFSASNPQALSMLAINIPIGLQFRENSGRITNQSVVRDVNNDLVGLQVDSGKSLSLVGGDVNLEGGKLKAEGGRIELGGLVKSGTVSFNSDGSLSFPDGVVRGDVSLRNGAKVVSLIEQKMKENGADVIINARSLSMSAAFLSTSTKGQGNSGNIQINVTDSISVTSGSILGAITVGSGNAGNIVIQAKDATVSFDGRGTGISTTPFGALFERQGFMGTGQGADITINARTLSVTNGAVLLAGTLGKGNSGNIQINATDSISVTNGSILGAFTVGSGNAGNIVIQAKDASVALSGGSQLSSSTSGQGNAGIVVVLAKDSVSLTGEGTKIFSEAESNAQGNAGGVAIKAKSISLRDRAQLSTSTFAQQDTDGNPNIAGAILLLADNAIFLRDGSKLSSTNSGKGNAGNIILGAGEQIALNHSSISTDGNFGRILLGKNYIYPDTSSSPKIISLDSSSLSTTNSGTGDAGDINLGASEQIALNQSSINSDGKLGRILIGKNNVYPNTSSPKIISLDSSSLSTTNSGIGFAGDINLSASEQIALDSSSLSTTNSGTGFAGNINLGASEQIALTQSSISSNGKLGLILIGKNDIYPNTFSPRMVSLDGSILKATNSSVTNAEDTAINAGEISIAAVDSISLLNKSVIDSSTARLGNAGSVTLQAENGDIGLADGSTIFSTVEQGKDNAGNAVMTQGNGGEINLAARHITLKDGAQLQTIVRPEQQGNAGNITVKASGNITFSGFANEGEFPSGIRSDVESNIHGNAGNIDIQARAIFLKDNAQLSSTNTSTGYAGDINLGASEQIALNQSSIISDGNFGRIFLGKNDIYPNTSSPRIVSLDGSTLSTTNNRVQGAEDTAINAGNVLIDASDSISLNNSSIQAFTQRLGDGGSIAIKTGALSLTNGSTLLSTNAGRGGTAGDIDIDVRDTINLSGYTTQPLDGGKQLLYFNQISSGVGLGAIGNGGDVNITAGSLSMNDFSIISTATSGRGNAGKLSVKVNDFIQLANLSQFRSNVEPGGIGVGGDIDINARSLTLTDGAEIAAAVMRQASGPSAGGGKAGDININATDFVNISGVSSTPNRFADSSDSSKILLTEGYSSGLFASAETGTTATDSKASGDINITTGNFLLTNGAVVDALTSNAGNGGKITINAKSFTATGGGQVLTTTRGSGRAGDIFLNISDGITLSGIDPNFNERLERVEQAIKDNSLNELPTDIVTNQGSASGIFANTSPDSLGDAGTITIDPRTLVIRDRAGIGVNSQGKGKGGNIEINSGNLTLDNNAFISANTASNQGGDIFLTIGDLLLLRRNSNISTNAGTDQAGGDGGNIKIDSDFIAALSSENSDITADAFTGRGGRVEITAKGIFGIKPRNYQTQRSDITASSEFGITGTVTLNTPNVDPSHGLVELPKNVVDPTEQIAQNPCQRGLASKFIITGRGGLPPSPNEATSSDAVRVDLVEPAPGGSGGAGEQRRSTSATLSGQGAEEKGKSSVAKSIVPAQGWIFDKNGEVMLTGYDPTGTGLQRPVNSDACPVP